MGVNVRGHHGKDGIMTWDWYMEKHKKKHKKNKKKKKNSWLLLQWL